MTPDATAPAPAPAAPSRRRWKRVWRPLAVLTLGAGLLGVAIGWQLWHHRADYASRLLRHYLPEWSPSLGELDISAGEIRLKNVRLHDPDSGELVGSVDVLSAGQWIDALRHHRAGRVRIDGLRLQTSAARLPALLAALPRSPPPATPSAAASQPAAAFSVEGIEWNDLRVDFAGDDHLPSVAFTLNHRVERFDWQNGAPRFEVAEVDLRDFDLRTPDGSRLRLPVLTVKAAFDPATGQLEIHDLILAGTQLELEPGWLTWLNAWRSESTEPGPGLPAWFRGVRVRRGAWRELEVKAERGLPGLPALAGESHISLETQDLDWQAESGVISQGATRLTLTQTRLQSPNGSLPGHLMVPELTLELAPKKADAPWQIDGLTLTAPDLHWTAAWENAMAASPSAGSPTPTTPSPSNTASTGPAVRLQKVNLTEGRVRLEKTPRVPFDLSSRLEAQLSELVFAEGQWRSQRSQRLALRDIETQIPGSRTAEPTRIQHLELEVVPDALIQTGRVERLRLQQPHLVYHIDFHDLATASETPNAPPPAAAPLPAFLGKLHFGDLAIQEGSVRVHGRLGAPFETRTSFELLTETSEAHASTHHLTIDETRLTATERAPLPVARVGRFEARARLPDLITERRLESLALIGGQVEFGDALLSILDPGTSSTATKGEAVPSAPAVETPLKKWHAGSVVVRDLDITLQRVAPGLPPFTFGVQFEAKDTPLEPEGLVENLEPQKVELSSLTIPAPYGSLRPVARLDSIFVHFTLDGLLRRRIGKVEILNPTLYVGEPLFWYVDYYRKFAAGDIKSDSDAPRMALASAENEVALNAAAEAISGPPRQAWAVEELQVHSGKIVLAPKGVPLPGFNQPFPFSFTTRLQSGQFEAVFDIPPDNYPLPDLQLEFIGMKGQVQFNLPLKDVDNNLTETFTVDQIRWKQLHVEDGHLSITYDMNGIYGKFGGAAYEGYIEGGFDVYLNDSYTWDGWIAATGVRATEITEKLTPAYLLLDGKFNGSLIAAGDAKELYQADLDCTSIEAGTFSISSLDDMLNDLPPPATAALTDQVTRIGLETLRDFDYDQVHAKGRVHGREGNGFLKIAGPRGSRNIEVNVFDHRWKVDRPAQTSSD